MKHKITILGGTDGFGKWLAFFIAKSFGEYTEITITGRNAEKGEKAVVEGKKLGYSVIYSRDNKTSVEDADITIFAVPIAYMEQTISDIAPFMKKGSVAVDVCSIKGFPQQALEKYAPDGMLIIPTHPMFGPYVQTIASQIFVLTPDEKGKKEMRYVFLKNFLKTSGAKVIEATSEEHDKMMAVVQGLTHYDVFVFGETIKRLGVDIEKSLNFVSPIYKIMLSSVARYMSHNPKLYGDIQMYNPEILKVHETFIEVSKDFNKYVETGDEENFISTIEETQEYFGENAQKGQVYTDKIIYMLSKQVEYVNNNIGKKLIFTKIYTGEIVEDVVEKFEKEVIYLASGRELVLDEWIVQLY